MTDKKCGFVAVIGEPNAGKSTLVNALVGAKVSIVSPKRQTTRFRITGITVHEDTQIVFVDTPGIFAPKKRYEKAMVRTAWDEIGNSDMIMLVVDAGRAARERGEPRFLKKLRLDEKKKTALVLNKVDTISKPDLLKIAARYSEAFKFDAFFMVSALKESGLEKILDYLSKELPEGEWLYDGDSISDFPMMLMASEITREQIYHRLHDELPYSISVKTDSWEDFENGSVKITQTIHVERSSQKGIVIGKNGSQLKRIGEEARQELIKITGCDVHLSLFVKVKENWMEDPSHYQPYGLDFNS